MNVIDVSKVIAVVSGTYAMTFTDSMTEMWYVHLKELDANVALEATMKLCRRDSPFPPRPGEIIAECERMTSDAPPSLEVATGYYLSGKWTAHPLVEKTARAVYWDRHVPDGRREFRDLYLAALHDHEVGAGRVALASVERLPDLARGDDGPAFRVV